MLNEQRRRALTFASDRMGYYEYSAPAGSSVDDIEAWKMANPAMGYTINEQNIKDAATFDSPDAFKTEMKQFIKKHEDLFSAIVSIILTFLPLTLILLSV